MVLEYTLTCFVFSFLTMFTWDWKKYVYVYVLGVTDILYTKKQFESVLLKWNLYNRTKLKKILTTLLCMYQKSISI